jgi:hypothetical protein
VSLAHRGEHVTEPATAKRPRRRVEADRDREQPPVGADDRVDRPPDIERPCRHDGPTDEEHERPDGGEATIGDHRTETHPAAHRRHLSFRFAASWVIR